MFSMVEDAGALAVAYTCVPGVYKSTGLWNLRSSWQGDTGSQFATFSSSIQGPLSPSLCRMCVLLMYSTFPPLSVTE